MADEDVDSEALEVWRGDPHTARMRAALEEKVRETAQALISVGLASTDPAVRDVAARHQVLSSWHRELFS